MVGAPTPVDAFSRWLGELTSIDYKLITQGLTEEKVKELEQFGQKSWEPIENAAEQAHRSAVIFRRHGPPCRDSIRA